MSTLAHTLRVNALKIKVFGIMLWNGILGIIAEIALIIVFIIAGLAITLFWWRFF